MPSGDSKICFVICPIGHKDSEQRKRSDLVLKYIITPAVEQFGYKVLRADTISTPGMITMDILNHLIDDPLVIADLTDHNPNVFYELAVRHAAKKPVISIIKDGLTIPFDVAQSRTIFYDETNMESVHTCINDIASQLREIEVNPSNTLNPISLAIDFKELGSTGNVVQRSTSEILAMVRDISINVQKLSPMEASNAVWDYPIHYSLWDMLQSAERRASERDWARQIHELDFLLLQLGEGHTSELANQVAHIDQFNDEIKTEFPNITYSTLRNPSADEMYRSKAFETADIVVAVVLEPNLTELIGLLLTKTWLRRKIYILIPKEGVSVVFSAGQLKDQIPRHHIMYFDITEAGYFWTLPEFLKGLLYAICVTIYRRG